MIKFKENEGASGCFRMKVFKGGKLVETYEDNNLIVNGAKAKRTSDCYAMLFASPNYASLSCLSGATKNLLQIRSPRTVGDAVFLSDNYFSLITKSTGSAKINPSDHFLIGF
jgi:hypothetical protein